MTLADDEMRIHCAERLASQFCRRYGFRQANREDVIPGMLVGMSDAATRSGDARGMPFEAFARKWMVGEAIKGLARRGGVPRRHWAKGVRCAQPLNDDVGRAFLVS